MGVIEKELIFDRRDEICDKETGCRYMIENRRVEELKLLFKCYCRNEVNLGIIV